jgi:hypothetical protein
MDEPLYSSLQDIFAIQDGVVATNQRAAQARIELIERGLIHGFNIIAHLESPNVMNQVEGLPPDALASHGIIKNLLHSALATDVSAVRLTLQGMYVEAFTLIRSAFELTYHAEYFRTRPREALEWDQLGQVIDLKTFAEGIFKIDRKVGGRSPKSMVMTLRATTANSALLAATQTPARSTCALNLAFLDSETLDLHQLARWRPQSTVLVKCSMG